MPVPSPEQDRVHEPRDDPRWRESYYFSFFDQAHGVGGFSSIGKRPSKGHAGFINVLWGPGIPTLVASEFDSVERHDDHHDVAGLTYDAREDFGAWRLAFSGPLNDGGSEVECSRDALGPTAKSSRDKVEVEFELTFTPSHGPYLYEEGEEWRNLFDGHIDEVGAVRGELRIDGEQFAIDGRGAKDHSWGVRDWFKPDAWRWVDLVGDGELEAALWRADIDGTWIGDGALYGAGGKPEAITSYEERMTSTDDRERKPRPTGIELSIASQSHRAQLSGEVVKLVPIFFGREINGSRLTSWNDRALVRCSWPGGSVAWANVEFESLLREPAPA